MSETSRTPYKKNNVKETCERCGKKKKKQVSDVAAYHIISVICSAPVTKWT